MGDRVENLNGEVGVFEKSEGQEIGGDRGREQPSSSPAVLPRRNQKAHHEIEDDRDQDDRQEAKIPIAIEGERCGR